MSSLSRRKLVTGGLAAAAGVSGVAAAARIADGYGLIPPDHGGVFGPGEALNYASQRLLTTRSMAREFPRGAISNPPFANGAPPSGGVYESLQAGKFADWRLSIDGLVARPASLTVAAVKSYPTRSQITHLACEEGWSYIAEWIGVPLSHVLDAVGILPEARYVVYFSIEKEWWDSIDMADALHPQTLLAHGMNGGDLPPAFGGPLRMRVPRQLGYKNVKYLTRLTVTDSLKSFGSGKGSSAPDAGYAWYAGI